MKVIAFSGSPRKKWNTATLLEKALEGASSQGAKTELIHLHDLNYKGGFILLSYPTAFLQ
jgi:multimeric flavodoxin WrbA